MNETELAPAVENCNDSEPLDISIIEASPKQIGYQILRQSGLSKQEAAKRCNYKMSSAHSIESRLKKLSLVNPRIVKIARKSIERIAAGEPVGDMSDVKGSDVLTACKMIYDRAEPVIQKVEQTSLNATVNITPEQESQIDEVLSRLGLLG